MPAECENCEAEIADDEPLHYVRSQEPPIPATSGASYWHEQARDKVFDERILCDRCWRQCRALGLYVYLNRNALIENESRETAQILMGVIGEGAYDDGEVVTVDGHTLAGFLSRWKDRPVYALYGFSKTPITPQDMLTAAVEMASGTAEADLYARYSEITGFLWVEENGKIGGHDMVTLFRRRLGEYGCLIVSPNPIDLVVLADSSSD